MHRFLLSLLSLISLIGTSHASTNFPQDINGMEMVQVTMYDSVAAGFSIRYEPLQSLDKLDLYLYTNGYENLPDGISDPVRTEYDEIYSAIVQMEELGYYVGVTKPKRGESTITLGGEKISYLWGYTQFKQTSKATGVKDTDSVRSSFYFVTAYQGRLMKLRYTIIESKFTTAFDRFMKVVDDLEAQMN